MRLHKINASPLRFKIVSCLYLTHAQVRLHLESGMYPFTSTYIQMSVYDDAVTRGTQDYLLKVLNEMVKLGALVKGTMVIPGDGLFVPKRVRKTWHLAGREAIDIANINRGVAVNPLQLIDVQDSSERKAVNKLAPLDLQQRELMTRINRSG